MTVDDTTEGDWDSDGGASNTYFAGQTAKRNYDNAIKTLKSLPEKKYSNIHSLVEHITKINELKNLVERETLTGSLADIIDSFEKRYKKPEIKKAFKDITYYLRDDYLK